MANKYNPECISYRVDPTLIEAGIPIEELERRDMKVFEHRQTMGELNRYAQKTDKLAGDPRKKKAEIAPKTPKRLGRRVRATPVKTEEDKPKLILSTATLDCIILTVESADYAALKSRRSITIPSIHIKSIGKKFQIINKATNSYCFRILCQVMGDKGYFV